MNPSTQSFMSMIPDKVADDLLVARIAGLVRERLEEKRAAGAGGWHTGSASSADLLQRLQRNLEQGHLVDVIALAGMLHVRRELYGQFTDWVTSQLPMVKTPGGSNDTVAAAPRYTKLDAEGATLPKDSTQHSVLVDTHLQLMIDVRKHPMMKYRAAKAFAEESRLLGFSDWTLPKVEDLFRIADRTGFKPAAHPALLPNIESRWAWALEVYPEYPVDYAFGVYFYDGTADFYHQDHDGLVLPVRSLAVPASQ